MQPNVTFDYARYCGANNCPADILPVSSTTPSKQSIYLLVGVLIGICVIGLVNTICFMDDIEIEAEEKKEKKKGSRLAATCEAI